MLFFAEMLQSENTKENSNPQTHFRLRKSLSAATLKSPAQRTPKKIVSEDTPTKVFLQPKPVWNAEVIRIPEKTRTNLTPHPSRTKGSVNQLRSCPEQTLKKAAQEKQTSDVFDGSYLLVKEGKNELDYEFLYFKEKAKNKALQKEVERLQCSIEKSLCFQ